MPSRTVGSGEAGEAPDDELLARLRADIAERDELFALAAHELRNPLHALTLQLGLATNLAQSHGQPEVVARLKKAQSTLARYVDRVTVMLELAALNGGGYPLTMRTVDLRATLQTLVETLAPEASFRGMVLQLQAPEPCWMDTDALAIEQIVQNLLSNALKHSGGTQVRIELSGGADHGAVDITVSDDGHGIAHEDAERVFGKFGVAARTPRGTGTGLGLWIVRKLLDALHGTIALQRSPEGGCLFRVRVPALPRVKVTP